MTVYLTLLVLAGVGLAVPLCVALADRATGTVVLDRTSDATRLASLAEQAVVSGNGAGVAGELVAYHAVYGIDALVLDRDGGVVASGRPGLSLAEFDRPGWTVRAGTTLPDPVLSALAGTRVGAEQRLWPWSSHPLLVIEPIASGGEVVGVVVTASPTEALRREIALQWLLVAVGVGIALVAGGAATAPLTRWVLRPVADLEAAVREVGRGQLDTRVTRVRGPDELQHLAASFNDMAGTVTTLVERQRTFVAYAGHQIRNPLAALRLRIESLAGHLPEAGHPAHQLALDELDRLTRTCDGLLALARADEGVGPATDTYEVAPVVHDRLRAWQPIADRQGAGLRAAVEPGLVVRTIEGSVEQALDALVDNALKFGGAGVTVTVTAHGGATINDRPAVTLQVVDDGPGLPADQLAAASHPFWRTPGQDAPGGGRRHRAVASAAAGGAGGSGLGLSIVVTLLELDGGRLDLSPVEPHGVRAVITLPDPAQASPPSGADPAAPSAGSDLA